MRRAVWTFLSLVCSLPGAFCQQQATAKSFVTPRDAHPLDRIAVPATYSQTAAYWTTEEGWHTDLHVRNNMGDASLVLSPTLHDVSGKAFPLPTITLAPKAGKVLDLQTLIGQSAPALVGQYGSLQLEYQAVGFRALYAAVMIHRMAKPIVFHVDTFGSAVDLAEGSREGIWWLPTKDSTDTLIITNRASQEVKATLRVTGASARKFDLPLILAPFGSTRLSVKALLAEHGITDEYGGVELHALKNAGYLDTVHFVVDEQTHFSALLKMFHYSEQDSMATRKWSNDTAWVTRAPMLAPDQSRPGTSFA